MTGSKLFSRGRGWLGPKALPARGSPAESAPDAGAGTTPEAVPARADPEGLRRQTMALWWLALLECGNQRLAEDAVSVAVLALCRQPATEQEDPAQGWAALVSGMKSALGGPHSGHPHAGETADCEALALTLGGYDGPDVTKLTEMPLGEVRLGIRRSLTAVAGPLRAGLLGVRRPNG